MPPTEMYCRPGDAIYTHLAGCLIYRAVYKGDGIFNFGRDFGMTGLVKDETVSPRLTRMRPGEDIKR